MPKLGDLVKDPITGYNGVVIAYSTYLQGCSRCGVQSRELKDGRRIEPEWFDEPQLEVVQEGFYPVKIKAGQDPGGPAYCVDPGR